MQNFIDSVLPLCEKKIGAVTSGVSLVFLVNKQFCYKIVTQIFKIVIYYIYHEETIPDTHNDMMKLDAKIAKNIWDNIQKVKDLRPGKFLHLIENMIKFIFWVSPELFFKTDKPRNLLFKIFNPFFLLHVKKNFWESFTRNWAVQIF